MGRRRMLGKSSGAGFFFDDIGFQPVILFANRKLTSLSGNEAFDLRPAFGTPNTYNGTVLYNSDGGLTASSTVVSGPIGINTLGDAITAGLRVLGNWNQMDGSSTRSTTQVANNSSFLALDTNGNAYFSSFGASYDYAIAFGINQPYTIVQVSKLLNNSNFKVNWSIRDSSNVVHSQHNQQRFLNFGQVSFGTSRIITQDATNAQYVITYIGNGASGNVYIDNTAKNPLNMGSNNVAATDTFRYDLSSITSLWAIFDFGLSPAQISDMVNGFKTYIQP